MNMSTDQTSDPARERSASTDMDNMEAHKEQQNREHQTSGLASASLSHSLSMNDPGNPLNWPIHRRVFTSFQGWACAFTVAVGLTTFSAAAKPFAKDFNLNPNIPEKFNAGFSLYLFGIAFAPIWVPHVTERIGRSTSYFIYILFNGLFNLGAGLSDSVTSVLVCRFFAGFFGGPCLVLLEGTFADIWSADYTNTYYACQGVASYWGAALGPLIGGYLVNATNGWKWTQYFPAALAGAALLLILNMPETYNREIPRRRGKVLNKTRAEIIAEQEPAQSGVSISQMANCTVVTPLVQFLTQPVVTLVTIIMFITWLLTFQFFISVPAALGPAPPKGPGFSIVGIGKAFLGAVAGSGLAALSVIGTEALTNAHLRRKMKNGPMSRFSAVEYRVLPAIAGVVFITIGIFWVGNTVNPSFKPIVPITASGFFIWGSAMITFSIVPYTFDLFQPAGTLSAITAQAIGRILAAAFLPLLILQVITSKLTPKWGFGLFGFMTLILWPMPVALFFFGGRWRERSKYSMIQG